MAAASSTSPKAGFHVSRPYSVFSLPKVPTGSLLLATMVDDAKEIASISKTGLSRLWHKHSIKSSNRRIGGLEEEEDSRLVDSLAWLYSVLRTVESGQLARSSTIIFWLRGYVLVRTIVGRPKSLYSPCTYTYFISARTRFHLFLNVLL